MAKPEIQFVGPVVDRRPKPPRNGYGKWGLLLPIISCGTLAPLGLLLSMRGLFGRPKTTAVLGTLLNGAICTMVFLPIGVHLAEHAERQHRRHEHARREQHEQDRIVVSQTIEQANARIHQFAVAHQGALPDGVEGNKLIAEFNDPWEKPLRYDMPLNVETSSYTIRSAGRDHKFETRDDIQVDYATGASRNDAGIPTAAPTAEAPLSQPAPLGDALRRIEVQGRDGKTFVVVINR